MYSDPKLEIEEVAFKSFTILLFLCNQQVFLGRLFSFQLQNTKFTNKKLGPPNKTFWSGRKTGLFFAGIISFYFLNTFKSLQGNRMGWFKNTRRSFNFIISYNKWWYRHPRKFRHTISKVQLPMTCLIDRVLDGTGMKYQCGFPI